MTDLVALYHAVASLGLPGAIFLALVGSWRGWFIWKREADELREALKAQEERYQFVVAEKEEYKRAALYGEQIARHTAQATRRGTEPQA